MTWKKYPVRQTTNSNTNMSVQSAPNETQKPADSNVLGHHYDGIREYDNPMPGWWIWIFWATIIFTPIYILGVHVFGFVDTYDDDLAESQAELAERREAFEASNPSTEIDEAFLTSFVEDESAVEAGDRLYQVNCTPCHGSAGEGGIGPNLTDNYWIHGNSYQSMFDIVTNGVIEKGMTPWESIMSVEERAQVVAFVATLIGTDPPNAKAPQGELIES